MTTFENCKDIYILTAGELHKLRVSSCVPHSANPVNVDVVADNVTYLFKKNECCAYVGQWLNGKPAYISTSKAMLKEHLAGVIERDQELIKQYRKGLRDAKELFSILEA